MRHFWTCLSHLHHLNITLAPIQKQMCIPHGFCRSGTAAERPTDRWSQSSLFILHYGTFMILFGVWSKEQHLFFLWRSNPTHWILLQHNGYSSLLSTLLWQTCTDTMSQHEKVSRTATPKVKWGDLSGDQPYQRRTFVNKIKNTPFKARLMW